MDIDFRRFKAFIFDFDGVMFDTNSIKLAAIKAAVPQTILKSKRDQFLRYFSANNGLPREIKIRKFFSDEQSVKILSSYEESLARQMPRARPMRGFLEFLRVLMSGSCRGIPRYILSGGSQPEINLLLSQHNITSCFEKIMTGPKLKEQHLSTLELKMPALYFGDSKVDVEIAKAFGLRLIFVSGRSDCEDMPGTLSILPDAVEIRDFRELINDTENWN